MKKIIVVVLLSFIISGCQQQKEEPKSKPQFPAGPIQAQDTLKLAVVLADDFKDKARAIKEFEKYLQLAPNAQNAEQIRQEVQRLKTSK